MLNINLYNKQISVSSIVSKTWQRYHIRKGAENSEIGILSKDNVKYRKECVYENEKES